MSLILRARNPCCEFLFVLTRRSIATNPASIASCVGKNRSNPSSKGEWNGAHVDFVPERCLGISESVIPRCSYIWEKQVNNFAANSSLHDVLKLGRDLLPETIRRFWRVSELKPEDFLEILLGFGLDANSRKVMFLWSLFRWSSKQSCDFHHLPRSYEVMIVMLIRAQMFENAESLLLSAETLGVFSGINEIYSEIIQGYAQGCKLEKSIALYNRARDQGLVLSSLCYWALLDLLIRMENAELAVRVYTDKIEFGLVLASEERFLDFVIISLTKNGRILESVQVLRKARGLGFKVSPLVLTAMTEAYCTKKDFEDMLNFMVEWKHIPEAHVCNKIVSSLCRNLSAEEAWLLVQRMEILGFEQDATTFGILISQSCREGKLRDAFVYLSECFSRSIKPEVHVYNALISGVFKEGLYEHAKDIFDDMIEKEVLPDLLTFKVLLAGYCRYRKFGEVKVVFNEMIKHGVISLSLPEDILSKAFVMLGLDHLGVRVKRDNDAGLLKAEFFDSLGNGLYLEADLEEYEMILAGILDNAMIPDLNSILLKECNRGDVENALRVKNEVVQWGQNLSLLSYFELLKCLCASPSYTKEATNLLEEMPELWNKLDNSILNLLVISLSKNRTSVSMREILDRLLKREIMIESNTCTALIKGFSKERNISRLWQCLRLAQTRMRSPRPKDIKAIVSCLCELGMIYEVLKLCDSMIEKYPDLLTSICNVLIKELCLTGFTCAACLLVEEVLHRNLVLDHQAYVILIKGFLKEEKFAEALGIVDICLEKNIDTCADVYQLLVSALLSFNQVEKAINLKEYFLNKQFEADVLVYNTLINKLCKFGKISAATIQLREILGNGKFPDDDALNALIQGYCRENDLMKAFEILCIMVKMHVYLSVSGYRSLVRQMCRHDNVNKALSLKELIQGQVGSESLIFYNILMFYVFHSGKSSLVKALFSEMQKKQIIPDQSTYNFLIYSLHKCGNASNTVEILDTIIAKGQRPSNRSLRIVICYLCSHGKLGEALELSKLMECNGWLHDTMVQNALAGGLLSLGRFCEAEFFLDRMKEKNLLPRNVNYDLLIKQLCVHGRFKKAVDLLNIMLKMGGLPSENTYSAVIRGLCVCKEFGQALDLHAEMQQNNLEPSSEACDALIYGLSVNGRTDEAKRILREMVQFGPFPTYNMYRYVLDRLYAENNLEKASELVHEMQENGYSPDFETHWSLISNLSSCDGNDPNDGKGFLSLLLSQSGLQLKDSTAASSSTYASLPP